MTYTSPQTPVLANVNANAASVQIFPGGTGRGRTVSNDAGQVLYLAFGTVAASTTNYTVALAAKSGSAVAYYEVPAAYAGPIQGIWAAADAGAARTTSW